MVRLRGKDSSPLSHEHLKDFYCKTEGLKHLMGRAAGLSQDSWAKSDKDDFQKKPTFVCPLAATWSFIHIVSRNHHYLI